MWENVGRKRERWEIWERGEWVRDEWERWKRDERETENAPSLDFCLRFLGLPLSWNSTPKNSFSNHASAGFFACKHNRSMFKRIWYRLNHVSCLSLYLYEITSLRPFFYNLRQCINLIYHFALRQHLCSLLRSLPTSFPTHAPCKRDARTVIWDK